MTDDQTDSKAALQTPTDLEDAARAAVTSAVNVLVADAFAFYVKLKNFHWHLSGPHFRDYHLLFDEQAEQVFNSIDILAERVRRLGGTTIRSIGHIQKLQTIKDDEDEFVDAQEMVKRLLADSQEFTGNLRDAHQVCDDHHDVATASVLENFIDESEQRTWFLFETQAQV